MIVTGAVIRQGDILADDISANTRWLVRGDFRKKKVDRNQRVNVLFTRVTTISSMNHYCNQYKEEKLWKEERFLLQQR